MVRTADVARSPGHVFYERLNGLLGEAGFDEFVEALTAPFYAAGDCSGRAFPDAVRRELRPASENPVIYVL